MFEDLFDILIGAVVCLSAVAAWVNLWYRWRERRDDLLSKRRNQLKEVLSELKTISFWASTEYDEFAHSNAWYNPYFHVRPFPYGKVEDFNWREDIVLFEEEIFDKLHLLEDSVHQFLNLLRRREEYQNSCEATFLNKIVSKISKEERNTSRETVDALEIQSDNKLDDKEIDCVKRVYELNKAIHVQGIGTAKNPQSLYSTFKEAYQYVEKRLEELKPKTPYLVLAGHILSTILCFIGITLLLLFFVRFHVFLLR